MPLINSSTSSLAPYSLSTRLQSHSESQSKLISSQQVMLSPLTYPRVQQQPSEQHYVELLRTLFSYDLLSRDSTLDCFYPFNGSLQLQAGVLTLQIAFTKQHHNEPRTEPICVGGLETNGTMFHPKFPWTRAQFVVITSISLIVGAFFIVAATMRFKNYIKRKRERRRKQMNTKETNKNQRRRNQSIRILQYNSNKLLSTCSIGRTPNELYPTPFSQQEKGFARISSIKKSDANTHVSEGDPANMSQSVTTVTFLSDSQGPNSLRRSMKLDTSRLFQKGSPRPESPSSGTFGSKKKLNRQNSLTEEIDSILHKHFGSRPRPNAANNLPNSLQRSSSSNNLPMTMHKVTRQLLLRSNTLSGLSGSPMKSSTVIRGPNGVTLRPSRWNRETILLAASYQDALKRSSSISNKLNHSAAATQLSNEMRHGPQGNGPVKGNLNKRLSPNSHIDNCMNPTMSLGIASSESALSQLLPDQVQTCEGSPSVSSFTKAPLIPNHKTISIGLAPSLSKSSRPHSSTNMETDV